jgi:hypothetical protein
VTATGVTTGRGVSPHPASNTATLIEQLVAIR